MNQKIIKKAQELRSRGFTTGEIADELNVSEDTARWLTMAKLGAKEDKSDEGAPSDFAVNWNEIGESPKRIKHVSEAIADMVLKYGPFDVVLGIAISGVPFATYISDYLYEEEGIETSIAVFHPKKHKKDKNMAKNDSYEGALSDNFSKVNGKKILIVDDVITSGRTIKEVISYLKEQGSQPVAVAVLIDKKALNEIDNVPVTSLIKVSRLG